MKPGPREPWQSVAGRRLEPPAWQRWLLKSLVIALGIVVLGIAATYLVPVRKDYEAVMAEEARVMIQLEEMRQLHAREEAKLHWLRNDDAYLEVQARDKLDLQAPGETIVRFQNSQ